MSIAREQLIGCLGQEFSCTADAILRDHAHELVQKIRKEGNETSGKLELGLL